ncbi:hypothetical protein L218DRAFT_301504 [Marasmius fiardii PR-910]|nr:hypothetical protein L218DRAFT_301504 [Marasmius fiardii PR-910]
MSEYSSVLFLTVSCWNIDPAVRPSAEELPSQIKFNKPDLAAARADWNDTLSHEIWDNIDHQETRSTALEFESHRILETHLPSERPQHVGNEDEKDI